MSDFKVDQIDHVHIYVPDRREAVRWYADVLGLVPLEESSSADDEDDGPLVISSDGGSTSLALFRAREDRPAPGAGTTVAFRVGGEAFIEFLRRLYVLEIAKQGGGRLKPSDVVDHDYCFSLYFTDPFGNPYELTTYDYLKVGARLGPDAHSHD